MTKEEYEAFYNELVNAESVQLKSFENLKVYEGCMPVEVLAKRGIESVRYGCMKPVGLIDPRTDRRPYAVVQLRKENNEGTLYNLVGFQTNLKFGEQKKSILDDNGASECGICKIRRYAQEHIP